MVINYGINLPAKTIGHQPTTTFFRCKCNLRKNNVVIVYKYTGVGGLKQKY